MHRLFVCALAVLVAGGMSASAEDLLWGDFSDIGEIDSNTGLLSNIQNLNGDGEELYGLATEPGTNTIFGITNEANWVSTVDPATGVVTHVAELMSGGVSFGFDGSNDATWVSGITFQDNGTMWGVVGADGGEALPGGAIFTVDLNTGEATDSGIAPVGAGAQAIEYNPDDGLLYHFYNDSFGGGGSTFFRAIDPGSGSITDIPLSGHDFNAVNGLTYGGDGMFYAYDRAGGNDDLIAITTDGVASLLHADTGAIATALTTMEYVPEPTAGLILGLGLVALVRRR